MKSVTCFILALGLALGAAAQAFAGTGTLQFQMVHGASLEGNLNGENPNRDVEIYLPPSYATSPTKRYPVVYLLHGFGGNAMAWVQPEVAINTQMDTLINAGAIQEMILVMPGAFTSTGGSFYVNSSTEGNWEDFIAHDLVAYVDSHFRTIAQPWARGIGGHSMGGFGSLHTAFRHPEVFQSVYSLSPCCTTWAADFTLHDPTWIPALGMHTLADMQANFAAHPVSMIFRSMTVAFSPDPSDPPLRGGFPVQLLGGVVSPKAPASAAWENILLLNVAKSNLVSVKKLRAIGFEAGTHDEFVHIPASLPALDAYLTAQGVAHTYELFDGTHVDHINERISQHMLPFFSATLKPPYVRIPPRVLVPAIRRPGPIPEGPRPVEHPQTVAPALPQVQGPH